MSAAAARAAIVASIRQDRIAWLEWSSALEDALKLEADDGAENGDVVEFWGERDGEYWRVHLDRDAARASARLERGLDNIWARHRRGQTTRREAEIAHDRALLGAGLLPDFSASAGDCDPRGD